MAHVIAISNQKGGVGKTTTCISLGACLVESGEQTLIVDMDSQSNLTMTVGLDPDSLEFALPDLLGTEQSATIPKVTDVIKPTNMPGLDILPSDVRMASAERILYDIPEYEKILGKVLSEISSAYTYILLDCPPSLGALTLLALTTAQHVLVPVQCEYFAARGLVRLLDVVAAVRQHTNPALVYWLVVTLFDKRNNISLRVLEQLQENFGEHLLQSMIGIDTRLRESAVVGEPIILFAPQSRASEQYRLLSAEISQKL